MNAPSIAVTSQRAPKALEHARSLALASIAADSADTTPLGEEAVAFGCAEGLGPLLGARVARGRIAVPSERRDSLIRESQLCLATNVVREHAATRFGARCGRLGIRVAWLKGMALIQGILGPDERSMIDVDVLVPASQWEAACRIAVELGGRPLDLPARAYTLAHDYVRAFTEPSGVTIEVHRSVCESSLFGIDHDGPDGLFARSTVSASGLSVLDDGDLFLTLAAHAAKHTFDLPLRSFFDGLVMLQRRPLKLDALAERAVRWRMGRAFHLWMQMLHALAPWLAGAPAGQPLRWPALAGAVWSRTGDASAWQRFLRLAWLADQPAHWVRHVLTRVALRMGDVVQPPRSGP